MESDAGAGRLFGLQKGAASAAKLLSLEFATVATTAYTTSELYHRLVVPDATVATQYWGAALLLAALYCGATLWLGDFGHLQNFRRQRLLWNAVRASVLAFAFLVSGMFLLKISDEYSRGAFIAQFAAICIASLALRGALIGRQQRALETGRLAMRRAFLVGDPVEATGLSQRLRASGIVTVAQFPFDLLESGPDGEDGRRLIDACRGLCADDIFILPKPGQLRRIKTLTDQLSQLPVAVHVLVPGFDGLLSAAEILEFGDVTSMQIQGRPLSALDELLKRSFDVIFASALLVVASPFMLGAAVLVKLTSRGPILFRQTRHGYNNQAITVLKFRTMRVEGNEGGFRQTTRNDQRVTWIGGWLRALSIDELPQLFNVLRGEMSLVGPRPHALAHNKMFEERIPPLSRRHNVKPGITGWAQVHLLRGETDTLEKMQKRVEFDLFYIDNWSFYLDIKIVVLTALLLLSPKNYQNSY
ncbi:exopolysaccharide biosynthesis polyprenyl glycosylphosphotransferase [Bradyrhizobium jicamae]|uniref:exopolysaccharide biosynthesis polyprenyl glycosylphosphotransferase n=1 Tax=Bradyrhizobium jicamae TaxID=280332 RepID=UPI002010F29C|nr:exopolysaccharide biosynthesis polyprenyl glycosylphosphotransferase [Bradyrhizobium jicamae]